MTAFSVGAMHHLLAGIGRTVLDRMTTVIENITKGGRETKMLWLNGGTARETSLPPIQQLKYDYLR